MSNTNIVIAVPANQVPSQEEETASQYSNTDTIARAQEIGHLDNEQRDHHLSQETETGKTGK